MGMEDDKCSKKMHKKCSSNAQSGFTSLQSNKYVQWYFDQICSIVSCQFCKTKNVQDGQILRRCTKRSIHTHVHLLTYLVAMSRRLQPCHRFTGTGLCPDGVVRGLRASRFIREIQIAVVSPHLAPAAVAVVRRRVHSQRRLQPQSWNVWCLV